MPSVKPIDEALLKTMFAQHKLVVSLEEHSIHGGFGSSIAEWLVKNPSPKAKFYYFGTNDQFFHEACELEYAREHMGLGEDAILKKILAMVGG